MDDIDWEIMDSLLRDARTTLTTIGKKLGLGKDTIQKRVKKLQKQGLLGTPIAILDSKNCGFKGIIDFFIKFTPKITIDEKEITNQLTELPFLLSIANTEGDYNLYLSSFFRSVEDVGKIVDLISEIPEISHFEFVVYSKNVSLPILIPFVDGNPENSIIYKLKS
jgi:Lrp/AsnC family leucine-responsive transcriptional regulator